MSLSQIRESTDLDEILTGLSLESSYFSHIFSRRRRIILEQQQCCNDPSSPPHSDCLCCLLVLVPKQWEDDQIPYYHIMISYHMLPWLFLPKVLHLFSCSNVCIQQLTVSSSKCPDPGHWILESMGAGILKSHCVVLSIASCTHWLLALFQISDRFLPQW